MTIAVEVEVLSAAAECLARIGQHDRALELLPSGTDDVRVAVLRATISINRGYPTGTHVRSTELADARSIVSDAHGIQVSWDLRFLEAKQDFYRELFAPGRVLGSPEGRDPHVLADLVTRLRQLEADGPDDGRRGWACFVLGTVHDNFEGERALAPALYERALSLGQNHGDDYLIFEALRHLGDHAHDAGDNTLACA